MKENLNLNITNDNGLYDLQEVINELESLYNKPFDVHAMSEYKLYLQGQKDMLGKVIHYLKKVL